MIRTRSLTKWFGSFCAVNAISFEVAPGEVVGFLGPNGAGKSTTLRMIAGYLPATSGSASVAGCEVDARSREVRRSIGYMPESTPLYPEMRVAEYLRFRARLFGLPRRDHLRAIDGVLGRCWLNDVRRQPIGQLSKGYRQRVGLATALLHNPPVLLLDEPTSGLDPSQIREVRGLIRELAGDHTILLSTHILPEVEMTCDKVIIIARGEIRAMGRIDELQEQASQRPTYIVEIKSAQGCPSIRTLPGVEGVEANSLGGGWMRLAVRAAKDAGDLREPIAGALVQASIPMRELHRERPTLEQLFIRLTSEFEPAEAGPVAPPAGVRP